MSDSLCEKYEPTALSFYYRMRFPVVACFSDKVKKYSYLNSRRTMGRASSVNESENCGRQIGDQEGGDDGYKHVHKVLFQLGLSVLFLLIFAYDVPTTHLYLPEGTYNADVEE
ncbi:hypothetical protein E2C01_023361 [Portunus trituberculatus]|uniref:Uncharacterized protein n=1 Tax=Portunus trituberculatus TaxID=210409 RepID=A0A5B7EBD2_PORTR|nr:hypothetical protein [Portunus trituberculatus]